MRWRRPSGCQAPRGLLEGVEGLAVREVADRVDGDREPGRCAAADDIRELVAARDLDAGAVEQARGLRPERAVHERLQVADADEVVAEAAADVQGGDLVHLLGGDGLPHAQVERALVAQALPDAERAEPAVLVVHGGDASADRDAHSFA